MRANAPTVAVFGGGVGGLSAAHELAERGFDVAVYEANDRFGGKVRSVPVPDSAPDGRGPLLGEHGFRFFPGFYCHLPDTMRRIPDGGGRVSDNLVATERTLVAGAAGEAITTSTAKPRTVREWLRALRPASLQRVSGAEARFFAGRLLTLLTSCEARRREEFERTSWWRFIDAAGRSPEYRRYLGRTLQPLVALRPERGSARTVGQIYLQLLRGQLDPSVPAERVLDGPTGEVWIDPWVAYLDGRGVDLHPGVEARAIHVDRGRVTGVTIADGDGEGRVTADYYVMAVPVEVMVDLVTDGVRRAAPSLARIDRLETAWMNGIQFYLTEDVPLVRGHCVYTDSPWALTSISQRQFWDPDAFDFDRRGDPAVEGVLSVIISDWETPGILYDKPARGCTPTEIRDEVWAQLEAHHDRGKRRLDADLVHDWFLDPAIVETDDGLANRAPLFVNTVGSLRHRPDAATEAENLLLAADYVRTNTDLASMEGANEAARRAVNAIVERSGARADPCRVWPLKEPAAVAPLQRQDALRYRLGLPHPGQVEMSTRRLLRALAA